MQRSVALVEFDPFRADLTNDTSPEGVVAVDDDHLPQRGDTSVHLAGDEGCEHVEIGVSIGDVRNLVAQRIHDFVLVDGEGRVVVGRGDDGQTGQARERGRKIRLRLSQHDVFGR